MMRPRHRDHLSRRLQRVFADYAERILLADQQVALTGADLECHLETWRGAIDEEIPDGGYVGVLATPSAVQAAAILLLMAAGRVPVMLNPWTPASRSQAGDGRWFHGVVCSGVDAGHLSPWGPRITVDRRGDIVALDAPAADREQPPPAAPATGSLVLHTSGSTGTPKPVLLAAEGLLYMADELIVRFGLDTRTVAALALPIYHTSGLNTQLLPTVFAGGRAVISSPRWLMGRLYREVLDSGANFVTLVNDILRPSLEEQRRRRLPSAMAVTEVQLVGSTSQPRHLEMARELFPAARIHRCYGLTEAIRVAMIASDEEGFEGESSGRVLPGQEIAIRDPEALGPSGQPVGEIWARGPSVMLGYLESGELKGPESCWLATGDLGYLTTDGRLVVEGRRDRVFKSYGHRIAPTEIEHVVLAMPAVAEAYCISVPCATRGRRPVLFLEPVEAFGNGHLAALEQTLLKSLDPYKVPKEIVVVTTLPRSAAGKVDLAALDQLWHRRVTDSAADRRPSVVDLGRGPAGCRFISLTSEAQEGVS